MLDYSKRTVRQMDIATSHDASAPPSVMDGRAWKEAGRKPTYALHIQNTDHENEHLLITLAASGFQDQHMERSLVPEGWIGLVLRRFCDVCDPVK